MTSRLQRIEIRNFKAFREFALDLEGRHLLVYGPNGSGKSSLYWALYTFLQSARKQTPGVTKYFDPSDEQNLLNIYEDANTLPGEIALTLRDSKTKNDTTYHISQDTHGTKQEPAILKGDLASDFITYRFFFGFSHFRNSEEFDVWPLFEKEILPFCVSTGGLVPLDAWRRIKGGVANPYRYSGVAGQDAYSNFKKRTEDFAAMLPGIVDSISTEAERFYDNHFSHDDPSKVTLKLAVTTEPSFTGTNQWDSHFTRPEIRFGIQVGGQTIDRPQTFLNEAKLTQLALSVRFAASLVNLHESDLKLLVLDDLLVSLDMSNRMKVVEILLSDTFDSYQKIILTHDMGFFLEFRRRIGAAHPDWCFLRFEGTPDQKISYANEKSEVQKAEEYLQGHSLDEAALSLRKACEDTAKTFLNRDHIVKPTKKFTGLREHLRKARMNVLSELPVNLYESVLKDASAAQLKLLVTENDSDIDGNSLLDEQAKADLKKKRRELRKLLSEEHVELLRRVKLIDDILECTARVLNPAAHSGNPPLYEKEVQHALNLVKQLQSALNP